MKRPLYGLMAEFENPEEVVEAARKAYDAGFRKLDAYSPFPIEELSEAVGFHHTWLPWIVLGGGIAGALAGFGMQYYLSVIEYPLNVGGRPLNSWPSFIPVTFEMTILFAALSAVVGMIVLNGLPKPYHPVFNVPGFVRASRNRFFLCIEAADPKFDVERTRQFLRELKAVEVSDVEP
jgi:hypothetical protein